MFVCSVFFLFFWNCTSKPKPSTFLNEYDNTHLLKCFGFQWLFLHKTTWREYFDTLRVQDVMRWLCAPFFFFSLLFSSLLKNYSVECNCSLQSGSLFWNHFVCFFVYVSCYICIRQHDVNILMFWAAQDVMRWSCAPFFFSFLSKIIRLEQNT